MSVRALAALVAVVALVSAQSAGAASPPPERPSLAAATAAILIDARDGAVIAKKAVGRRSSIASATKLMTALLTLERARMDAVFRAADYDALPVESKIDLRRGERMRVEDLLRALLVESANDAAATLAEGIAGSRAAFVAAMNERAVELGLSDTSYANPIGLDDRRNFSTARDLARLARLLLADPRFARIVDSPSVTLESGARPRTLENRNGLVARYPFVDGVKTGHTDDAGYVLVGAATGASGARVVSVVLGEPSTTARDSDTLALLRYGLAQFRRVPALKPSVEVATVGVEYRDERVGLVPARRVTVLARDGERVRTRVDAPYELGGELGAGTEVGQVTILRDGEVVRRVPLVTAERVPGAGLPRKIASTLGLSLTLFVLLVMVSAMGFMGMRGRSTRRSRERDARRRARARAVESEAAEPVAEP